MPQQTDRKPCVFAPSSLEILSSFDQEVKDEIGFALHVAQRGGTHRSAKPLTGHPEFRGAAVMEIVADFDGDTYRGVYTVKLEGVVYALDIFQKKSKSGIATSKSVINRIKARLRWAREHYREHYEKHLSAPKKKK